MPAILIFLLVMPVFYLFALEETDTPINFIELPDGALVDARIEKEAVEIIFRHFQAIEDGDLSAFRDTLVAPQDMVDVYSQIELMARYFGDIVNVDEAAFHHAMGSFDGSLRLIMDRFFTGEYNPVPRNTGMRIQVIRFEPHFRMIVELTNNKNEHITYWILAGTGGVGQHINPQHFQR